MSEPTQHSGPSRPERKHALTELLGKDLIEPAGGQFQATNRWRAALARAARFFAEHEEMRQDIRLPISKALLDIYGDRLDDDSLVAAVDIMLDIQRRAVGDDVKHH